MANRLAALLWDVDGTLAETELEGHRPAFNAAFADLGLPWRWDPPTYLRLLAVSGGLVREPPPLKQTLPSGVRRSIRSLRWTDCNPR